MKGKSFKLNITPTLKSSLKKKDKIPNVIHLHK